MARLGIFASRRIAEIGLFKLSYSPVPRIGKLVTVMHNRRLSSFWYTSRLCCMSSTLDIHGLRNLGKFMPVLGKKALSW